MAENGTVPRIWYLTGTVVLKRDGPRGSGRWKTVPLDRAVEEIVQGGRLFADVSGEALDIC